MSWAARLDTTLDALFNSGLVGIAAVEGTTIVRVNDECSRILGQPKDALEGGASTAIATTQPLHQRASYERDYTRPDGERRTLLIEAAPVDGDHPGGRVVYQIVDITERQQRAAELENTRTLLIRAVDSMSDGFVLFDAEDRIVLCNQIYASMLDGFPSAASMAGMSAEDIIRSQIEHGQPVPAEFANDIERWVANRIALHRRADGKPHVQQLSDGRWVQSIRHRTPDGGIVVLRSDITAFKRQEMLAHHDSLTGLPNRRLLHDRLAQALARARRAGDLVAVLLVDLDDFKPVNDTYGHKGGDDVLRVTAGRLRECLRRQDTVARFGGDEFIVVIDGLGKEPDIALVAGKILAAVAQPIDLSSSVAGASDVRIGCSIGVSMSPRDGHDPDVLIRLADAAMYRAKQAGRGTYLEHHS